MRLSTAKRLFLTCWILFSIHFATNIVREHYPAFSLIESGTLQVDEYYGFHSDIFLHADGHAYVGNNVTASYLAVPPLLVFDPILDALESYEQAKIEREGVPEAEYRVPDHPNSRLFFERATRAGLTLRFGASAAVTTVFLMAPLSALMVVLMFWILVDRGVRERSAVWLSLVFAFGTPLFFRTGVLNHNTMQLYATFTAFHLLWARPGRPFPVPVRRRAGAGFLAGLTLALDYSGVVPLLALFGYLLISGIRASSATRAIRDSIPFVLASVPPVLFLLYTQWEMFGNPFLPGQYWMPDASETFGEFENPYSQEGFRGFTLPALDLYFLNLFDPAYGLYVYGPLLLLALVPARIHADAFRRGELILPRRERIFVAIFFFAFLTFCAANQYSRLQWNSGFRYLVPVVPLLYLAASDHLLRMPRRWLVALLVPVLANSWVTGMVREPVPESWSRVLSEGVQLPWHTVLRATRPVGHPLGSRLIPLGVILVALTAVWLLWRRWSPRPEPSRTASLE